MPRPFCDHLINVEERSAHECNGEDNGSGFRRRISIKYESVGVVEHRMGEVRYCCGWSSGRFEAKMLRGTRESQTILNCNAKARRRKRVWAPLSSKLANMESENEMKGG